MANTLYDNFFPLEVHFKMDTLSITQVVYDDAPHSLGQLKEKIERQ